MQRTNRFEEYRAEYNADSPAMVDVLEFDASHADDVYTDLGDLATAPEEREPHERASKGSRLHDLVS